MFYRAQMPGEVEKSYRRMFPNWNNMTPEEKQKALTPEVLGRMDAAADYKAKDEASRRAKAFTEESERRRPRVAGPGVGI
jgi:hypothetical protein